jgi:hypothetical protein
VFQQLGVSRFRLGVRRLRFRLPYRLAWAPLSGSAGRDLQVCGQKFALDLKQADFDRAGATKSPQIACEPMNERKLDHCSRIDTVDEGTLERGLVSSANRGGVVGGGCFAGRSSEGPRHPIGSLGLHIATILEVQPLSPC